MKKIIHTPGMILAEGVLLVLLTLVLISFLLRREYVRTPEATLKEFILENHLLTMEELMVLPEEGFQLYQLPSMNKQQPELPVPAVLLDPAGLNKKSFLQELTEGNTNIILYSDDLILAAKTATWLYQMGTQKLFVLVPRGFEQYAGESLRYTFVRDSAAAEAE
ncbi:MAG: hypothetical protein U0T82_15015 [Bacteroidales bacterium]